MRKAIILSNAGESGSENYCNGVHVDVKNYIDFLTSPLGGLWYKSEIEHVDRPTCEQVKNKISLLSGYEYTLIIYCGHGFVSSATGSTILELKKNEHLHSVELRQQSNKRTILLDCCRRVHEEQIFEKALKAALSFSEPQLNPSLCRAYYDTCISKCERGVIVGYACSRGETAKESASAGGYYSSSLINAAEVWKDDARPDLRSYHYSSSIIKIHNAACANVHKLSGGTQTPDIEKPRSEPYFPFAVMA